MNVMSTISTGSMQSQMRPVMPSSVSEAAFSLPTLDRSVAVDDRRAQVEEAAQQLVASAFLVPMLGAASEGPFATGIASSGVGEKRFQPMLHAALADRMAGSGRFPLVDAIVDRLMGSSPLTAPEKGGFDVKV